MSSYFDEKSHRVACASSQFRSNHAFIGVVADIEQDLIRDVVLVAGDREFPADLREKVMKTIAEWHVGKYAGLEPRQEAVRTAEIMRMSELVEHMHSLFHEVASRRIRTRFGLLSDHPPDILNRRDEHDAA